MATVRTWRAGHQADGPYPARLEDIGALNQVFSDAFTERYRRDGMVGVRVPFLNPSIWRYAIEDADGGALLWRDERDEIVAFNIVHRSGIEGWMGPNDKYDPAPPTDRVVVPLGRDAAVVNAEVNLCGTSNGTRFCSRIRFADTFVKVGKDWRVAHIQVTRLN